MAYADYQSPQVGALLNQQQQPKLGFTDARPYGGIAGSAYGLGGGFSAGQTTVAPDSNNQLPTNTRQQNLQQVQQAYAQRMPGDMGYLNGLLDQSAQAPTADDPIMRGAFAAGRVADQRLFDRQRAALAERLGSQGLGSSGAMNVGAEKYRQQIGENQALRESGMLYDESNARRNALLQALGLDQGRYGIDQNLGVDLARLESQLNQNALQPFF